MRLNPDIDKWPPKMRRPWAQADILAMARTRDEVKLSYDATGEPVHFFPGTRCTKCGFIAPWLVGEDMCTVCKHLKNQQRTDDRAKKVNRQHDRLGFGRKEMPGGGAGYTRLIPPSDCKIARSDDRETNKARRTSCPEGLVRDHTVHCGSWPLADGVYVIGLEVAENLLPMTNAMNWRKGNKLPDPNDYSRAANRPLIIAEQRKFVRKRMAIWAHDLVWVDSIVGGRLERVRWELYRFGYDGLVEYLGVEPTGMVEAAE